MMYHEVTIYKQYTEEQLKLIYEFIQDQYESALDDYDSMENNTLYEAGHEREVIHNLQDQTKLICLFQSIKDQLIELIIVDQEGGEKK